MGMIRRSALAAMVGGVAACTVAPLTTSVRTRIDPSRANALRTRIATYAQDERLVGIGFALVEGGQTVLTDAVGWADAERQRPMTADSLQNIASITKTVTATAAMILVQRGMLDLDAPIEEHLSYNLRNPRFPGQAITLRQLLAHTSSIRDTSAYHQSYRCGDQEQSLAAWLANYFAPGDTLAEQFHEWAPGTLDSAELPRGTDVAPRGYSNVAYGVIGNAMEGVTGQSYEALMNDLIFDRLGMDASGFALASVDQEGHAFPYIVLPDDFDPTTFGGGLKELGRFTPEEHPPEAGGLWPLCLYSFATAPDGLLRTSVNDLARYLAAWASGGAAFFPRAFANEALTTSQFANRHLIWHRRSELYSSKDPIPGGPVWEHTGGDPGVSSVAAFRPETGQGWLAIMRGNSRSRDAEGLLTILMEA